MLRFLKKLFQNYAPDEFNEGEVECGDRPITAGVSLFLSLFCNSNETQIEISPTLIQEGAELYSELNGLEYYKVRNRFRIMSRLNPGGNQSLEVGVIQLRLGFLDNSMKVEIETRFPAGSDTFTLKIISKNVSSSRLEV